MWADFTEGPRNTFLRLLTSDIEFSLGEGSSPPRTWVEVAAMIEPLMATAWYLHIRLLDVSPIEYGPAEYRSMILNERHEHQGSSLREMYEEWRLDFIGEPSRENAAHEGGGA